MLNFRALPRSRRRGASELETDHGVPIDVVSCRRRGARRRGPLAGRLRSRAMVNARRSSPRAPVDVYLTPSAEEATSGLRARPAGPGFDPAAVPVRPAAACCSRASPAHGAPRGHSRSTRTTAAPARGRNVVLSLTTGSAAGPSLPRRTGGAPRGVGATLGPRQPTSWGPARPRTRGARGAGVSLERPPAAHVTGPSSPTGGPGAGVCDMNRSRRHRSTTTEPVRAGVRA